jgi:hypothetical protein
MGDLIQISRKPPAASPEAPTAWPAVIERLRQRAGVRPRSSSEEACEFCGVAIDTSHGHLVDVPRRALLCVCRGCYLLFTQEGAGGARFRAVPTRFVELSESDIGNDAWEALDVPIGLAFFFRNSGTDRVTAFYPSPAGATESELTLDAWQSLADRSHQLRTLAPDVEALLVRRTASGAVALIVPIDVCYELVGVIRVLWRGLQGGDELWGTVDEFFARALDRARGGAP